MQTLRIHVKPRSRARSLEQQSDGTWLARLTSPPVDGKANQELIALVAEHFGVPRSAVSLKSGAGARIKQVLVEQRR
jgi:uncharacterized protein (TIGR00251 family)